MLPWLARAAGRVNTAVAVLRVLEEADIARVEAILVECAKDANFEVNERRLGEGMRPTREQCDEVVGKDSKGNPVTRAMELENEKHRVALECADRKLQEILPGNFSLEPRYLKDSKTGALRLLQSDDVKKWLRDGLFRLLLGSLAPDVVLHASGDAFKIHAIYDFKFPCVPTKMPEWREYPLGHPFQKQNQRDVYRDSLGGERPPMIVSPNFGVTQ